MAALSRASGVPVPTIKFYLRQGLLPPGHRTSPTQSQYDEAHVRRLALIRSLTEIGGYSLATVADVLRVAGERDAAASRLSAILSKTVVTRITERPAAGVEPRFQLVDTVMRERGWRLTGNDEHRLMAATLLGILHSLGLHHSTSSMRAYAAAATLVADAEPARQQDVDTERAVLATVLDDALLASLRRMAQASAGAPQDAGLPAPRTSRHDSVPEAYADPAQPAVIHRKP